MRVLAPFGRHARTRPSCETVTAAALREPNLEDAAGKKGVKALTPSCLGAKLGSRSICEWTVCLVQCFYCPQ